MDRLEIFVTSMDRCSNGHSNKNAESIINEQFNYQHTTNNICSTVLCTEIVLENNYLTRVKTTDFAAVQGIEILNLKGNLISSIQPYAFIHMMPCKYLGLKANKLPSIEEDMFKGLRSQVKLSLLNNFIVG